MDLSVSEMWLEIGCVMLVVVVVLLESMTEPLDTLLSLEFGVSLSRLSNGVNNHGFCT